MNHTPVCSIPDLSGLDAPTSDLLLPDHPTAFRLPQTGNHGKGNPMFAPGDSTLMHSPNAGSGAQWA